MRLGLTGLVAPEIIPPTKVSDSYPVPPQFTSRPFALLFPEFHLKDCQIFVRIPSPRGPLAVPFAQMPFARLQDLFAAGLLQEV